MGVGKQVRVLAMWRCRNLRDVVTPVDNTRSQLLGWKLGFGSRMAGAGDGTCGEGIGGSQSEIWKERLPMNTEGVRVALGLALALCLLWAGCGDDNGTGSDGVVDNTDFSAEAAFYFRLDLGSHETLRLEGISGEVMITDVAGSDSVIISGVRRVRSESTEDAEEHLPRLEVAVQDLSDEVFVETRQPEQSMGRSYEVDYEIILPEVLDLDIANVNGQVILEDISGDALVDVVNGQVVGEVTLDTGGTLGIDVVNGAIDLGIPKTTSAEISAAVVNGYINVSGLTLLDSQSTTNSLTGRLGTGEGTITLTVTNGAIAVQGLD
jgi:hypothetical protein